LTKGTNINFYLSSLLCLLN